MSGCVFEFFFVVIGVIVCVCVVGCVFVIVSVCVRL